MAIQLDGVIHRFHFVNQASLKASHPDFLVNFLEYWEVTDQGELYFFWVSDIKVTQALAYSLMRGGRVRWKIENETFTPSKIKAITLTITLDTDSVF